MDEEIMGQAPDEELPEKKPIGQDELRKAVKALNDYKAGKRNLEDRVVKNEKWYQMRHWEVLRGQNAGKSEEEALPEPTSAWLFNTLMNKHADAMDNFPSPNILPREAGDQDDAKMLSSIVPVVLERNGFESTYSDEWWEKLKHGTGVYGVFWNPQTDNGLGDIDIRMIDLLNIFWEPGVTDIQKSRNLFILDSVDNDLLLAQYPQLEGHLGGDPVTLTKYLYDENVDTSEKSLVIDWYYKVRTAQGKTLLHYVKFVGDTLLFASENEPEYQENGWYEHGRYPVQFDTLYPEKGTPVGFGYIDITKDPQLYIDKMSANILQNSMMATKPRFFASTSTAINKKQFLDWNEPIIDVEGALDDNRVRQLEVGGMSSTYLDVMLQKIDEMKETASNRDVSSGGTASGVTAAAAIAALQEAGNKASRDMISASYRCYTSVVYLCIELIRQFYTEQRSFRILGQDAVNYEFVDFSNRGLTEKQVGVDAAGMPVYRRPVFDIKVQAQKRNPYNQLTQNEMAKEFYSMGFFDPERAQQAMGCLEMMEFEGKDKVAAYVRQGQTLQNVVMQMNQQMQQMGAMLQQLLGEGGATPQAAPQAEGQKAQSAGTAGGSLGSAVKNAQTATMTSYGEKLAQRAVPDVSSQQGMSV